MSGYLSEKIQKFWQNRVARVITKSPFDTSSNLLLAMLKWELSFRRKKQKALIMYKTLNDLAPDYLSCLFTQHHIKDYNLRNREQKLSLPKPNTNYLKRSFSYSGASCLWNNLPQDLKAFGLSGSLNGVSRRCLQNRIPTRQSCKTIVMTFSF